MMLFFVLYNFSWYAFVCLVSQLNRAEFEDVDDETRVQYEGFRPGMYVRLEIPSVPCEFVTNFDPHYPIILGGLGSSEGNVGYLQVRAVVYTWLTDSVLTSDGSLVWLRTTSGSLSLLLPSAVCTDTAVKGHCPLPASSKEQLVNALEHLAAKQAD